MTWSVVSHGSAYRNIQVDGVISPHVHPSQALAVGTLVVVGTAERPGSASQPTITDSKGNTYTFIRQQQDTTYNTIAMFYAVLTVALATSDTITYNPIGSTGDCGLVVLSVTGHDVASPLDTAVTNGVSGHNTGPVSLTSGTPTVPNELFITVGGTSNSGRYFNLDSSHSWSEPFINDTGSRPESATDGVGLGGGNQVNSGTGTKTFYPTLSGGNPCYGAIVVGFKPQNLFTSKVPQYPIQSGLPSDWVVDVGDADFSIAGDTTTTYSDRVLKDGAVRTEPTWISWPQADADNQELLALVKFSGQVVNGQYYQAAVVRAGQGGKAGYVFAFLADRNASSGIAGTQVAMEQWTGGASPNDRASLNFTWSLDTWYFIRLRVANNAGNYDVSSKVWALGVAEPGSWSITKTGWKATGSPANGDPGLCFSYNALKMACAGFSVGNAGQTAPWLGVWPVSHLFSGAGGLKANYQLPGNIYNVGQILLSGQGLLQARGKMAADSQISGKLVGSGNLQARAKTTPDWTIYNQPFSGEGGLNVDAIIPYRQSRRTYVGDHYVKRNKDDYASALTNLLPQGPAWPREKDKTLQKFVDGQAGIWGGNVEDAAELLLTKESDPRTTVVMLPDWERAWGLPDECVAEPLTIYDRQRALVKKMTLMGGQSRAFFVGAAADIGYKITIREYAPWMCGISEAGDTGALDDLGNYRWEIGRPEMRFYWSIRVGATRFTWFRCSSGEAGVDHHLEFARATDLECILNRWKPAHTEIVFDYSPLITSNMAQPFNLYQAVALGMM